MASQPAVPRLPSIVRDKPDARRGGRGRGPELPPSLGRTRGGMGGARSPTTRSHSLRLEDVPTRRSAPIRLAGHEEVQGTRTTEGPPADSLEVSRTLPPRRSRREGREDGIVPESRPPLLSRGLVIQTAGIPSA